MRLRRVAIDMKKRVRGRTVRTAESSLAGLQDTDGTAPASKGRCGVNPCLVLATDIDGISLIHEV